MHVFYVYCWGVCFQNDYVRLQVFKDELEQKIKNTHSDTAKWESEILQLTKENHELKRMQQAANVVSISVLGKYCCM